MTSDIPPSNEPGAASPSSIDSAQLKSALKAFRKRLKFSRLDDESHLGHGPMSSGSHSGIMAIVPPAQYPQAVWDELVRQGKLRRSSHGLYELLDKS
jgi:hypothetical protein